jgi:hypothetical protein
VEGRIDNKQSISGSLLQMAAEGLGHLLAVYVYLERTGALD